MPTPPTPTSPYSTPTDSTHGAAVHPLRLLRLTGAGTVTALATLALLLTLKAHAQGFPNVERTAGELISGLNAPEQGRTAIIAYHHGVLFTVPESPASVPPFDAQVRTWDLSNPAQPQVLELLGATRHPFNAHGYMKSGDYLIIGPNDPPEAPWSFRADGPQGSLERANFPGLLPPISRGDLFQPWTVSPAFWSYDDVAGDATLSKDGQALASWDHLAQTGVIGHPFILGDLLIFASDQSRTGVATYDIGDPQNPVLLDVLTTGGAGGYWPELWGGDGKLYIVFPYRTDGNGMRVVDATDPSNLAFIADLPLTGDEAMYAQFQDHYAFIGDHKIDLHSMQSVLFLDGLNTPRPGGGVGISTSQFALPLGNLLITGGAGENQGMAIWAHQSEPDTQGPTVGYHVPHDGATNYPVGAPISLLIHETLETPTIQNGVTFLVRPVGGQPVAGRMTFSFNDVLTFTPDVDLLPDTTYEVVLPANGIQDAAGNGMEAFAFTFSTGANVGGNAAPQLSDLQATPYPALPGADVDFTAAATDPDGDPVEYRFGFGDGSPRTEWSVSAGASHNYAAEGHFRATVQARDGAGALSTRSVTVTVRTPPTGPTPPRSTPLLCDDAGRRAFKVNPDNGTLTAVDLDTLAVLFEAPTCDDPRSVALAATTGELWVACHGGDAVRVHGADGATLAELPTGYGSAPFGVVADPDGDVFVSLYGRGELRRFQAATRQETGALALGPTPRALALTPDGGRLFVSRFLSLENRAEVWEVETAGFTVARTLWIRKFGNAEHRDGTANGRGTANYLAGLAVDPTGAELWVASTKPNTERGLLFGPELDSDNTRRTVLTRLDVATGAVLGDIDVDNSDSASAVAFSPLGDYLFATLQGNDDVVVLDALRVAQSSGLGSLVTRLAAGAGPQGVCVDPTTRRTVTANFTGRSVAVLDTDALLRRGEIQAAGQEIVTVGAEVLGADVLAGKRLFYFAGDPRMSAEGYLSCASCHLDGGHDGRTWDFTGRGEGLRNTTDLRGRGGVDHGNVHWTANFDEIQDFENDIRGAFGGQGFLEDADFAATQAPLGAAKAGLSPELDALSAYVSSLGRGSVPKSPFRTAAGAFTADAVAGEAHFSDLGCVSCHGGPRLTDSTTGTVTLHDVGTLRTTSGDRLGGPLPGLDTPTLRGLWAGAPFFHDGSARDLGEVFREAGGTLLPAETGTPADGAFIMADPTGAYLNYDDTLRGRALADLSPGGASLTFTGVDGGPGGPGALELRHSSTAATSVDIAVNGGLARTLNLPNPSNDPSYRHTQWEVSRLEDVELLAGAVNTIVLTANGSFPNLSLDDLTVTTAGDRAAADAHRQVGALNVQAQSELVAFLLQLDGSTVPSLEGGLFADNFESGDFSAWSSVVE